MQNNTVNKGVFNFWVPMPVYQYENRSGYVTDILLNYSYISANLSLDILIKKVHWLVYNIGIVKL